MATYRTALRISKRYATRNLKHEVLVVRPKGLVTDLEGRVTVDEETPIYGGCGRLWTVAGSGTIDDGQLVYLSSSYISLPWDVTQTQVDDLIQVTVHEDPSLMGRWFRVLNVDAGGILPVVRKHTVTSVQFSRSNPNRGRRENPA